VDVHAYAILKLPAFRSSSATEECVVPAIKIDNIHDPFATVVTVDMGDEISEMLETVRVQIERKVSDVDITPIKR
jgi:hypothetical protein